MLVLSKPKKYLLFSLWLWFWLYIPAFMLYVFSMIEWMQSAKHGHDSEQVFLSSFAIVFVVHFATIISVLAQCIFYIWHIITKNPALSQNGKVLWALVMFMFNTFVIPIYWWMYIRTAPETQEELDAMRSTHDIAQTFS